VQRRGRLGEAGLVALGDDRPGRDGVGADARRAVVDGERAGQALDRRLGGRVGQRAADRPLRLVGGDVDDRAAAALVEEGAHGGAAPGQRAAEVRADRLGDVVGRGGVQVEAADDRRVVDPAGQLTALAPTAAPTPRAPPVTTTLRIGSGLTAGPSAAARAR
jgi:hypothetical protein